MLDPTRDPTAAAPGDSSDELLLERMGEGDEAALQLLMDRYWSSLVHYAQALGCLADAAEDHAQRAFIGLWRRRSTWLSGGTVKAYLYTAIRNLASTERTRGRHRFRLIQQQATMPHSNPTPLDHLQHDELLRALEGAIAALPDRRREVFELVVMHGLSYKEVAATTGVAVPTVANQLSTALRALREVARQFSDVEAPGSHEFSSALSLE